MVKADRAMKPYEAKIFIGLKDRDTGLEFPFDELEKFCQDFVDLKGECVTVTRTKYIYTNGNETGAIIGFIQYPRFPRKEEEIKDRAIELAYIAMHKFKQQRVTVNTPEGAYMLTNPFKVKSLIEGAEL